jgi:hypothetical protein
LTESYGWPFDLTRLYHLSASSCVRIGQQRLSTLKSFLQVRARANRETAAAMLAGLLVLVGLYAYFWVRLYRGYFLIKDDPGNIGGTVDGAVRGWFARGMAGYYHVYPEWPQPGFSNFYRPVWNLIIFVEQAVFGQHWWAWFLAFCALQYFGTLLFLRVLRSLGVPSRPALVFAVLFLFNPAFLNFGFVYPGFQFDVIASLLLLAAFYLLLENRCGLALALITAAVFTKETTIFAPVAAAITVFVLRRDVKWSVAMLTPLLVWVAARWLAYHAVMGGTFASPANIGELLSNIGKGLIVWPSGAVPPNFPLRLTGAHGVAVLALLLINTVLWAILIYAGWETVRALRREPQKPESKLQAVLLIWVLGALAFCMLTRPQARFGASLYAFLFLFLATFLFAQSRPKYLRLLPILILSFVTLMSGGNFLRHAVAKNSADGRGEKALYAALRSLPQDGRAVFVVNAPTMLSAPRFLARTWNLKLDITFISQFGGCARAEPGESRYELSPTSLSVEIPPCAYTVFAGVPEDIQSKALTASLLRPGIGVYQFPGRPGGGKRLGSGDIDFGKVLQIQFTRAPATVLAYDWQDGTYRTLGSGPR